MIIRIFYRLNSLIKFGIKDFSIKSVPIIRGKVFLNVKGELTYGNNLAIVGQPWATKLTSEKGAHLKIGENVFINAGCGISASKEITIGNNVKIGPRTTILDNEYHLLDVDSSFDNLKRVITIEDNVWIGTRCTILPGVKIGKNSVIAAGSVVTCDIPENVLAGGTPARVIKELNIPTGWIRP